MALRHRRWLSGLVACLAIGCSDRVPLGAFARPPGPPAEPAGTGGGGGGGTPTAGAPASGGRSTGGASTGGVEPTGGASDATGGVSSGGAPDSCNQTGTPGGVNGRGVSATPAVTIPHTDWTWPDLLTSLEWDLTVETELERDGYFFTHQFSLESGAVGFLGLQPRGGYTPDLSQPEVIITNIIVFWISAPFGGSPPLDSELGDIQAPDARTSPQVQKNLQWLTINARYDFSICRTYRLRVTNDATDAEGNLWYSAYIRDLTTDIETYVGRILVPAEWGKMQVTTSMWSNRIGYQALSSCSDAEAASALFGTPSAVVDGETVAPSRSRNRYESPICPDARFTVLPNGVRHELGVSD
jgi:hypothetical protein